MHCDVKSLNFLVTKDLTVKLSDLGEARSIQASHGEFITSCTLTHSYSLLLTLTHSYSLLLTLTHAYSRLLTLTHSYSLLLTLTHSDVRQMPRSINWTSPEILTDSEGIKESADIWLL